MRSTGAVIVFDAAPAMAPFIAAMEKDFDGDDFDEDEEAAMVARSPTRPERVDNIVTSGDVAGAQTPQEDKTLTVSPPGSMPC